MAYLLTEGNHSPFRLPEKKRLLSVGNLRVISWVIICSPFIISTARLASSSIGFEPKICWIAR